MKRLFLYAIVGSIGCSGPRYGVGIASVSDCAPDRESLNARLLLIGDAGYPENPVMDLLMSWAQRAPEKTTIVFLGDNVYPNGITDADSILTSKRLQRQIDVVLKSKARGIFIPGNHDWGRDGKIAILNRQEAYVEKALPDSSFLPQNGCPGPVVIRGDPTLVILDTQWWFLKRKPLCDGAVYSPRTVVDSLIHIMRSTTGNTIVLGHHPLISYGFHAGAYDWRDIFFPLARVNRMLLIPLPFIGIAYPAFRAHALRSSQDLSSDAYRLMRGSLLASLAAYNGRLPLIYASGHDHSLQVIHEDASSPWLLVTGAGSDSKLTPVRLGQGSLFADQHSGFMALDYYGNGSLLLSVIETGRPKPVFCRNIR